MPKKEDVSGKPKAISGQVRFEGGEDVPILFANHVFIRSSPDGFLVSFAQSHGPYEVNVTQETIDKVGVPAKIIARLAIPTNRMREFSNIINTVLEQYDSIESEL